MEKTYVKELWGVEFPIVARGLAEDDVVSFVNKLMEENRRVKEERERQSSLLKLAEQTVVEADRLAESIKEQARQEAEEEASKIRAASEQQAQEQAQRVVRKAEREAAERSSAIIDEAKVEAQELTARAQKESQDIIQATRDKIPGIASEARLEAEYIVRRFTVNFVEELRAVVTETCGKMLPSLDELMKGAGHGSVLDQEANAQPAIVSSRSKAKPSVKQ